MLDASGPIAFDTETTGLLSWHGDAPFAVAFCDQHGIQAYTEWPVDPFTRAVTPCPHDLTAIAGILSDSTIKKIGHNVKFDARMMYRAFGIKTVNTEDTYIAARVVKSDENAYGLKHLAAKYFNIQADDEKTLLTTVNALRREGRKLDYDIGADPQCDYWLPRLMLPCTHPEHAATSQYCILDAKRTMLLWLMYKPMIDADECHTATYARERQLMQVIWQMESRGIAIDRPETKRQLRVWKSRKRTYREKLAHLLEEMYRYEADGESADRFAMLRIVMTKADELSYAKGAADFASGRAAKRKKPTNADLLYQTITEAINDNANANDSALGCAFLRERLNPASNPQIVKILRYLTGKPIISTGSDALLAYLDHDFVSTMLKYRECDKAIGTFFLNYLESMIPDKLSCGGWAVHPSFNQAATKTGRMAASSPNLQQVANPDTSARKSMIPAKCVFVARPGFDLYAFDYSQVELRMFAEESEEPTMLAAIKAGREIHTETANKAWGGVNNPRAVGNAISSLELDRNHDTVSSSEVAAAWKRLNYTPGDHSYDDMAQYAYSWLAEFDFDIVAAEESIGKKATRTRAKCTNFAKIYGGGARPIASLLRVSEEQAQSFIADYDATFPTIKQYMYRLGDQARRDGYVINRFGRKTMVNPDFAYTAVNYLIQGGAADLIKEAMLKVNALLRLTRKRAYMLLQIHDELVFEIHRSDVSDGMLRCIKRNMEDHGGRFSIPLPVEGSICVGNWQHKKKLEI